MSDTAIRVEGLGKRYRLGEGGSSGGQSTLRESVAGLASAAFRSARRKNGRAGPEEIWALRDVSFEVDHGEVLGVIGANGAGKSTLLKILSRITEPTEGAVDLYGRVGSLLEVGTGFHPELTGRENIYLNGAILGMRKVEIDRKFDEIVAFAEIDKFLDTPVKRYSSGMFVRLAFAVAAHLEPDILLVDEVLSVGDVSFQKKCLGKMGTVAREGRTILFVSHNMAAVRALCDRCLLVERGKIAVDGETDAALSRYLASHSKSGGFREWENGLANSGVDELKILSVSVLDHEQHSSDSLDFRFPFSIEIRYRVDRALPACRVGFYLATATGEVIFEAYDSDADSEPVPRGSGSYRAVCIVPGRLLSPGGYAISLKAGIPGLRNLVLSEGVLTFSILDTDRAGSLYLGARKGVIRPPCQWERSIIAEG